MARFLGQIAERKVLIWLLGGVTVVLLWYNSFAFLDNRLGGSFITPARLIGLVVGYFAWLIKYKWR